MSGVVACIDDMRALADHCGVVVASEAPDILAVGRPLSDALGRGTVVRDLVVRRPVPVSLVAVA